ncbi:hypothetical protein LCGC14_1635390 [marine sediment metagenome]|uniref:Uncharacterized protein n=1 Tax=marine sediment metagenome TaxID=412755 RepID=A0A0F9INL1_9ZZZZ
MNVRITQEDINRGKRMAITECPMARALTRKGRGEAVVVGRLASINQVLYRLSPSAAQWVSAFDQGLQVKPASLRLYKQERA